MSEFAFLAVFDEDGDLDAVTAMEEASLSLARAVSAAGHTLVLVGDQDWLQDLIDLEAPDARTAPDVSAAAAGACGIFIAGNVAASDLDDALACGVTVGCLTATMPASLTVRADVTDVSLDDGDAFAPYSYLLQVAVEEWAQPGGMSAQDIRDSAI